MKYYIISEERLKQLIKHERELGYVNVFSRFYRPSEKELEVTEENLKHFTGLEEYIKEHRDEILQNKWRRLKKSS